MCSTCANAPSARSCRRRNEVDWLDLERDRRHSCRRPSGPLTHSRDRLRARQRRRLHRRGDHQGASARGDRRQGRSTGRGSPASRSSSTKTTTCCKVIEQLRRLARADGHGGRRARIARRASPRRPTCWKRSPANFPTWARRPPCSTRQEDGTWIADGFIDIRQFSGMIGRRSRGRGEPLHPRWQAIS